MNNFMTFMNQNKPGLLLGAGIGCFLISTVSAFRLGSMAKDAIDERKAELGVDQLDAKETAKTAAPYIAPPLLFSIIGATCIFKGNQINAARSAAAVAAYAVSESAFREYREQTKQVVGEKKEKDIQEAVTKQIVMSAPLNDEGIILTGKGNFLCYDDIANQYFRANKNYIEKIIIRLNEEMITCGSTITINNYCTALGLNEVLLGNDLGWSVDTTGTIDPIIDTHELLGEPCYTISHYRKQPKSLY